MERTAPHMAVVSTSSSRSLRCKRFQKAEEGGTVADDARLSIRFHFLTARFTFQPHTFASSIHSEIHVHVNGGQSEKSFSLGNYSCLYKKRFRYSLNVCSLKKTRNCTGRVLNYISTMSFYFFCVLLFMVARIRSAIQFCCGCFFFRRQISEVVCAIATNLCHML